MIDYEIRRGGLVADPELRYTSAGAPVCCFTIAQSSRRYNEGSREWETVRAHYIDVNVWNIRRGDTEVPLAEIVAEHLKKGTRVMVHGLFATRSWEDRDGNRRSRLEFTADAVAVDVLSNDERGVTRSSVGGSGAWSTPPTSAGGGDEQPPF